MAGNTSCNLLLVLTAGFNPNAPDQPSVNGIRRLVRAGQVVRDGELRSDGKVAIVGGIREEGPSEADVYFEYIRVGMPELLKRVKYTSAKSKCTARDLVNFFKDSPFKKDLRIGIVSYERHCQRAAVTLKALGFHSVVYYPTTNEESHYGEVMERVLDIVTTLDPKWRVLGAPLVWMANRTRK